MKKMLIRGGAFVLCALFLLSVVGLTTLKLNTDVFALLPETPGIKNLKEYNSVFASLEKFSFSIVSNNSDVNKLFSASEYTAKELNKHPFFRGASHQFSLLSASQVKDFYQKQLPNLLTFEDLQKIDLSTESISSRMEEIFEQLVEIGPAAPEFRSDPLQISHLFWQKLQLTNLNSKIMRGCVVSKDEKALLLNVPSQKQHLSTTQAQKIWEYIYKLQQQVASKFAKTSLIVIGGKRVMLDNTSAIWRDAQLTSSLATISLAVLMLLVLKSFLLFPLLFVPVIFGVFVGIGISGLFAPQLSLITLGLGAVLIGVSVDYVIHYLIHFENSQENSRFKILKPMSFAAFSTCGALSFLFFSDFPVHQETAWFVATGIFSSFLFVAIAFPSICRKIPKSKRAKPIIDLPTILRRRGNIFTSILFVMSSLVLTLVSIYYLFDLQFSADMEQFNYTKPLTKENEDTFFSIWGNQKGKVAIAISAETLEDALQENEDFHSQIKQKQGITVLTKTFHLLPSLTRMRKNHEDWKRYWSPERQQKVVKIFAEVCEEYGFSQNAFAPFLNSLHSPRSPERIIQLLNNRVFAQFLANGVQQYQDKWYIQNIVQVSTGSSLQDLQQNTRKILIIDRRQILSEVSDILVKWARTAIIVVGIYISLLFFIYFVHIELVIIGLLPLALSLLWIFGMMAYLAIPLNLFSVLLIVFVLGLGVDYSTFLVTSYVEEIGTKNDILPTTRSAILLSAITTLIAFGVLIIAEHPALSSLGMCVLLAMTAVLFNTAFLTPIVLRYFIPPQRKSHSLRLITAINSLFCFILYFGGILLLTLFVFPSLVIVQKLLRVDTRRFCLLLIERINRYIMYLSLGSKIEFLNFPKNMRGHIIIVNHTNTVDIPLFNGMPFTKVTMVKWFWKYPLINFMLKQAGFLRAPSPHEKFHEHEWENECRDLLKEGYNILFFPEGTRAKSFKMGRFRMGAFRLATATKAPVLPVCFYGTRWTMDRGIRFVVRDCNLFASALSPITEQSPHYEEGARPLARYTKKLLLEEYERLAIEEFPSKVQINLVKDSYRYINHVIDMYLYFKIKFDKTYISTLKYIPREGNILDVGCGVGFLSQLMLYSAEKRKIWGMDYSAKKIDIAQRSCISYTKDYLHFIHGDIHCDLSTHFTENFFDAVLCCDVLHYCNPQKQQKLLKLLQLHMKQEALLVIRQDITKKKERSKFEKWGKKLGFNDFEEDTLFYPQQTILVEMLQQAGFDLVETQCQIAGQVIIIAKKIFQ
ncbi:1-acyl-sn-glycerol-3-phosphate acyltransferase [Candidatus Uabimicrobium sp. HlEnr_7]|uniref:1-acyl-sn-glycerol-3-phosphate acyltransferase n=1 Tax=Candidatus Uabimicrobium helgolandensis TaxID=3095367 RepID=UPI00355883DA